MVFLGRHQGYLPLGVGSPVLKQVVSGDRAIGICNTGQNAEALEICCAVFKRKGVFKCIAILCKRILKESFSIFLKNITLGEAGVTEYPEADVIHALVG